MTVTIDQSSIEIKDILAVHRHAGSLSSGFLRCSLCARVEPVQPRHETQKAMFDLYYCRASDDKLVSVNVNFDDVLGDAPVAYVGNTKLGFLDSRVLLLCRDCARAIGKLAV